LEGFTRRAAELNAAVQVETAKVMKTASEELCQSIDRFTEASNAGTRELARWNQQTANATKGLRLATWALFVAMLIQIGIMWYRG
jgi:hypothetical protein